MNVLPQDGPCAHGPLTVEIFTGGPFAENCYLAYAGGEALVIDPGHSVEAIAARVAELGLRCLAIANTHAHIDHVAAAVPMAEALSCASGASGGLPFWLHGDEQPVLDSVPMQARMFGLSSCPTPTVDRRLVHGERLELGGVVLEVLHTPGHSPGGCCFYAADAGVVFVGDTLFAGSVGRSDLPGGDHETLIASIRASLLSLPDEVVAYSGHGPHTLIGTERRSNPFLS